MSITATQAAPAQPAPAGVEIDGPAVRQLRKLGGRTLSKLAEDCGLSVAYLSAIERGTRPTVSPPAFVRICDALGIADRRELVRAA